MDFRAWDWATSSGRADKQLTKESVVLILCEHRVVGADGKTELLACNCKPELNVVRTVNAERTNVESWAKAAF